MISKEVEHFFIQKFNEFDFTKRESKVALLVLEGLSNVEIASLCRIKIKSVKDFTTKIYRKTQTINRAKFIILFYQEGINALPGGNNERRI